MLIRFHVSNFLSINEEVELSLIAGRVKKHPAHLVTEDTNCGVRTLRAAVIYGANASGKSNLIRAMRFAQRFVVYGTRIKQTIPRVPFKLCQESEIRPSRFEFEFRRGGNCYIYGFEVDHQRIHTEWLYQIKKTTEMLLFERTTTDEGKVSVQFGKVGFQDKEDQQFVAGVAKGTRSNQLFLTESMERNIPHFADVYQWFDETLVIIYPDSQYLPLASKIAEGDFAASIAQYLEQLGTGIYGFDLKVVNPEVEFPSDMMTEMREKLEVEENSIFVVGPRGERYIVELVGGQLQAKKLMFRHRMADCNEEVLFDIKEESDGTRRMLDLLPQFANLIGQDQVIVIDELDRSLHPRLSYELIRLFLADTESRAQLVVTTHEEHLLDLDLLRRDEIWFIEKDQSGASHLYSLEEFAPRYDKDIERGYMMGRFGAIPVFRRTSFARRV
ncbi:MAG: ATP-binding protein [Anaerolineae bacterium]|jgi:AAA15 family ATPase/GTPase|nr:ATP-binding protein [Anaerolineae bacterium]